MLKKVLMLGIVIILLFSLAGCGYPTYKFDSLEEMQEELSDKFSYHEGFHFFDFDQEGVKEAGKFQAMKRSKEGKYFRYSIWYDVEYEIDGQKQERKLRVVATDRRYPISSGNNNTKTYRNIINQIFSSWYDSVDSDGLSCRGVAFNESKKVLSLAGDSAHYSYYFLLEEVKASIIEDELESFLSICKFAIENKYQIS